MNVEATCWNSFHLWKQKNYNHKPHDQTSFLASLEKTSRMNHLWHILKFKKSMVLVLLDYKLEGWVCQIKLFIQPGRIILHDINLESNSNSARNPQEDSITTVGAVIPTLIRSAPLLLHILFICFNHNNLCSPTAFSSLSCWHVTSWHNQR